jgi:selenocysteine lyase/cysteine desulfurase
LELADLRDLLNNNTRLVQVSLVSFYNGFRLDWDGLVELVKSKAPQAILAVDVTQALGRVSFDCTAADFIVSSTHKWGLGIHGSCVVGVPERRWDELTTHAGGWFHIVNAFGPDRFVAAEPKPGVESFSVGMPNFVSIYALNASLRFLEGIGIAKIEKYSNDLTHSLSTELKGLGINLLAPFELHRPTGIVAFRHPKAEQIYEYLLRSGIHVMYHAGRLRISVHFYNTEDDLRKILNCLHDWFSKTG